MQYQLEPYQERSVQMMMQNPFHYLAYEMGLGKTLIVLEYLRRTNQKALVVAPLLVAQRTWPQEIKKWGLFPGERGSVTLHGPDKDFLMRSDARVKVINYDGLKWMYNHISKLGSNDLADRVLVIDEGTCIKSPSSVRFKVLKSAQHFFRKGIFVLSGTPMPNGYIDLWSQYWMLDRGATLGRSFTEFKRRYFYESGPPRWVCELRPGAAEEIQRLITPMTSVLRAEDHLAMPKAIQREVEVELPVTVRKQYNELQKKYVWEHEDEKWTIDSAGVLVNKLRQVTQGAMYKREDGVEYDKLHEKKLDALESLVESAAGDPIVCAINFKFELDMICKRFGRDVPCIAGGMHLTKKEAILNKFGVGQVPLLLCHPASMSHGLNDLQERGHIIVWYSLPWSLEHYQQLNGRLIRRGQKRSVMLFHLVAKETIDKRISTVLCQKDVTQEDFRRAVLEGAREYQTT